MTAMGDREKVLTAQMVVRFTPEMLVRLQADAEANGRNVSQTIRLACARFLASSSIVSPDPGDPE